MYPAARNSMHGLVMVKTIFGSITMLSIVLVKLFGINLIPTAKPERHVNVVTGATCGYVAFPFNSRVGSRLII